MRWLTTVSLGVALGVLLLASRPAPPPPPPPPPAPPRVLLPLPLREAIAATFAPRLRFTAWSPQALPTAQNRNEDFLPTSVARFLRELASGEVRVVVRSEDGRAPSTTRIVRVGEAPRFTPTSLTGYPRFVAGDPPGQATTYTHVYAARAGQGRGAGPGEQAVFVEYWFFYPYDRSDARILGVPLADGWDLTGHRADWEHISMQVAVRIDGDRLAASRLIAVRFYGHGHCHEVPAAELERVDGHPVVYVSQGKHAAYPEPGEWLSPHVDPRLSEYHDVFLGNGAEIDTWTAPLVDLDDLDDPELDPPAFATLMARGQTPRLPNWTYYLGQWGPDDTGIHVPGKPEQAVGRSATGPRAKASFGDHWQGTAERWSEVAEQEEGRLRLYRRLGVGLPPVRPAPVPQR